MKYKVHRTSVREFSAEYDGPPFHAVLCDAPYGLGKNDAEDILGHWLSTGENSVSRGKSSKKCLVDVAHVSYVDDANDTNAYPIESFVSFRISLSLPELFMILSVKFDNKALGGKIEIDSDGMIANIEDLLMDEGDRKQFEFFLNSNFAIGVRDGDPRCVHSCTHFTFVNESLATIPIRFLCDSKTQTSSSVVTGTRAEINVMLGSEAGAISGKLCVTNRTNKNDFGLTILSVCRTKFVRTISGTSSLSLPLEARNINEIHFSTDGTVSFNLFAHVDLLDMIKESPIVSSSGFMNKGWDVIPPPADWKAIRELAAPGAVLMCFTGTRTADLVSIAIRLGGWDKFDQILHWTYASGFPKGHNISVAIDREAGVEREVVGPKIDLSSGKPMSPRQAAAGAGKDINDGFDRPWRHDDEKLDQARMVTAPATDEAKSWSGYYNALKPAVEPILVYRNELDGTYANNATEHGAAGLNIDATRIGEEERTYKGAGVWKAKIDSRMSGVGDTGTGMYDGRNAEKFYTVTGRWPANLVLSHLPGCKQLGTEQVDSDGHYPASRGNGGVSTSGHGGQDDLPERTTKGEVVIVWDCDDNCPVAELAGQSGILTSGAGPNYKNVSVKGYQANAYGVESRPPGAESIAYGDSGTAARFFFQSDWNYEVYERINNVAPVKYQAKASKREKNAGVELRPVKVNDGRKTEIDNPYQRGETMRRNTHPTIKPLKLLLWLATMLLPPKEYAPRRILVPYSGSGSEMIACLLAGWEEVFGIEVVDEYADIAEQRLGWWTDIMQYGSDDIDTIIKSWSEPDNEDSEDDGQLTLF